MLITKDTAHWVVSLVFNEIQSIDECAAVTLKKTPVTNYRQEMMHMFKIICIFVVRIL